MTKNTEKYDYIIMNNRIVYSEKKGLKKMETCFEKFEGEDVLSLKARNLVISKITKRTPN